MTDIMYKPFAYIVYCHILFIIYLAQRDPSNSCLYQYASTLHKVMPSNSFNLMIMMMIFELPYWMTHNQPQIKVAIILHPRHSPLIALKMVTFIPIRNRISPARPKVC